MTLPIAVAIFRSSFIFQQPRIKSSGTLDLPSEMSLSRISQAKIVGFSLLYCSILETTAGVATLGLDPPMRPGGRSWPVSNNSNKGSISCGGCRCIVNLYNN